MWGRKNRRSRRREFLIAPREEIHQTRKYRNRFLNFLRTLILVKHWGKRFFRISSLISIMLVLVSAFVIIAIFSPYFNLKKISFTAGNPTLNIDKVEKEMEEFYGKNLLFISHTEISNLLKQKFPEFRDVSIKEKWPSEIELKITISPPLANILDTQTADFWVVSEDGIILDHQANESLPIIKMEENEKPLAIQQKLMDGTKLKAILDAKWQEEKEVGLKIKEMDLFFLAEEVHLITNDEISIWIDLNQDVKSQIHKLALGAKKIGLENSKNKFEHIDLRIPNQIFWK